jgi:hypothetical protein
MTGNKLPRIRNFSKPLQPRKKKIVKDIVIQDVPKKLHSELLSIKLLPNYIQPNAE